MNSIRILLLRCPFCSNHGLDHVCTMLPSWKRLMNVSFMSDPSFLQTTKENWEKWRIHMKYYPKRAMCWCRYVKRMICQLFSREGADRHRDHIEMENIYYSAIYSECNTRHDTPDNSSSRTEKTKGKDKKTQQ